MLLPTVASRLALTVTVVGGCVGVIAGADVADVAAVVDNDDVAVPAAVVPPITTSTAADAAAAAAAAAAFAFAAAAAAALDALVDTDTAAPLAEPVILSRE
jgi:hypothetical protein